MHLAPNAELLLRVHQPERYADQPAAQRPLLLDALRDASSKVGMGIGDDGLSTHAITPLQVESSSGPLSIGAWNSASTCSATCSNWITNWTPG